MRLTRAKSLVNQISGLSESPEAGIEKVGELEKRMERKRDVLEEFQKEVIANFGNDKGKDEANGDIIGTTRVDESKEIEDEDKMDVD